MWDLLLQLAQSALLAVLIALGKWNLNETVETKSNVAAIRENTKQHSRQLETIETEIGALRSMDAQLDHRVTVLESRKGSAN